MTIPTNLKRPSAYESPVGVMRIDAHPSPKYRIIRTRDSFVVQKKVLFIWWSIADFWELLPAHRFILELTKVYHYDNEGRLL